MVNGMLRSYTMYIPKPTENERLPLWLIMHGTGNTVYDFLNYTGLGDFTKEHNVAYVAVQAIGETSTNGGEAQFNVGSHSQPLHDEVKALPTNRYKLVVTATKNSSVHWCMSELELFDVYRNRLTGTYLGGTEPNLEYGNSTEAIFDGESDRDGPEKWYCSPKQLGGNGLPAEIRFAVPPGKSLSKYKIRYARKGPWVARSSSLFVKLADGTWQRISGALGQASGNAGEIETFRADDIALMRTVLARVRHLPCIDKRRVHCVGYSNGGRFCMQLASEMSNQIASVAAVSGLRFPRPNNASRPIPVLAFHGTADPVNPWQGNGPWYWRDSVLEAFYRWSDFNGCRNPSKDPSFTPLRNTEGRAFITKNDDGCQQHASVELVKIKGAGHTWPGSRWHKPYVGPCNRKVDANSFILQFFDRSRMPEEDMTGSVGATVLDDAKAMGSERAFDTGFDLNGASLGLLSGRGMQPWSAVGAAAGIALLVPVAVVAASAAVCLLIRASRVGGAREDEGDDDARVVLLA